MPRLSIIVPVYNVDPFVNECLRSIKNQTFTDWECILVDDGSTDMSGIMCDSFSTQDNRFKVIHQENKGVSAARNKGIELAGADYLSFIDPDDYISGDYFRLLIERLEETGADFACSDNHFLVNGRIIKYPFLSIGDSILKTNDEVIERLCNNAFSCVCWKKVFKRSFWGNARFPVGIDLGEDMMTVPAVMARAKTAVCVKGAVYYYRFRQKSLLHGTVSEERYRRDLWASGEMVKQLCEIRPDRSDDFYILKAVYDAGCYREYVKSNPGMRRTSYLYQGYKALEDMGNVNLWEALRKKIKAHETE